MFKKQTKETIQISNDLDLTFTLKRSFRNNVSLRIGPKGTTVNAPFFYPKKNIHEFIKSKEKWIEDRINEFSSAQIPKDINQLKEIKILNKSYMIKIEEGQTQIKEHDFDIIIYLKNINDNQKIRKIFLTWLQKKALRYFNEEIERLSNEFNLKVKEVKISNAKTRWGTCNNDKIIRLNWRLIQAEPKIINYVICHELAHLKEMNHSKKFWLEVDKMCPNYKELSKALKKLGPELYRLG